MNGCASGGCRLVGAAIHKRVAVLAQQVFERLGTERGVVAGEDRRLSCVLRAGLHGEQHFALVQYVIAHLFADEEKCNRVVQAILVEDVEVRACDLDALSGVAFHLRA